MFLRLINFFSISLLIPPPENIEKQRFSDAVKGDQKGTLRGMSYVLISLTLNCFVFSKKKRSKKN